MLEHSWLAKRRGLCGFAYDDGIEFLLTCPEPVIVKRVALIAFSLVDKYEA
jgi:hypothetical protein